MISPKNVSTILLLLATVLSANGQTSDSTTKRDERTQPHTEARKLSMSERIWDVKVRTGYFLDSVSLRPCRNPSNWKRGVVDIINIDSTQEGFDVHIQLTTGCGYDLFAVADYIDEKNCLNLMYLTDGADVACSCCYGLTYHFDGDGEDATEKVERLMVNRDERTEVPFKDVLQFQGENYGNTPMDTAKGEKIDEKLEIKRMSGEKDTLRKD